MKELMYTLLEDRSPYYIKFTYNNLDRFVATARELYQDQNKLIARKSVTGNEIEFNQAQDVYSDKLIKLTPFGASLKLKHVFFFKCVPGMFFDAHVDSHACFHVNYPITLLDQAGYNHWYNNDMIEAKYLNGVPDATKGFSHIKNFDPDYAPSQSVVFAPNEAMLFNTKIYHSIDNRASRHERMVMALRPGNSEMSFDQARACLFNDQEHNNGFASL
jgi:hypothetical protein